MTSPVCDSYVRPMTLVRICDECSCELPLKLIRCWAKLISLVGQSAGKCIICGSPGEPGGARGKGRWS